MKFCKRIYAHGAGINAHSQVSRIFLTSCDPILIFCLEIDPGPKVKEVEIVTALLI